MNEYNQVNGNEDDELPRSLLNNEDQQMIVNASTQPIWPNTPISCVIPTTSKLGDTSPNSPGAYYATIQSTSSRWYAFFSLFPFNFFVNFSRFVLSLALFCLTGQFSTNFQRFFSNNISQLLNKFTAIQKSHRLLVYFHAKNAVLCKQSNVIFNQRQKKMCTELQLFYIYTYINMWLNNPVTSYTRVTIYYTFTSYHRLLCQK